MKKRVLLASTLFGVLMVSNVHAVPPYGPPTPPTKAPEISVASGASAIALLSGMLLLVGERRRTRRS